uniref:tRNA wybutosine-synthesizing protein 4 n=1 Tax=Euleptes europaea TaxID=460621 RepID=UPI0025414DF3|nr:tRNA wybutosine-synthesizing protein 4 [Euleptes europaea]
MGRRRRREAAVAGTGDSSAASKRSAAQLGYTRDPFAPRLAAPRPARRRAPPIHRGYYVRSRAVDHCAGAFLQAPGGHRQILSLGSGLDSLYFCLKARGLLGEAAFFEVDFPDVARHKAALIATQGELAAVAGCRALDRESGAVHFAGEDYRLLGVDLAELPKLEEALSCAGLDPQAPTMLLAEVVLTYMEVERSDALIQWAARHFSQAWFVLYEQIHPEDPFGHVMQNHFRRCNSQLCSLAQYPDLKAQQMRFLQKGWAECHAIDMNEFFACFVSGDERRRIQALEPFDEFEEWHLKCSHYFILVASRGEGLRRAPVFPGVEEKAFPGFAGMVAASVCAADMGITGLRRYGHRSVRIAPHVILTTGGFGDHGGRHCRLTDLHALVKDGEKWTSGDVCLAKSGNSWDGRLFHTVTLLQPGWAVVLGGRLSPVSPAQEVCGLRMLEADGSSTPLSCPVVELTRLPPVEDPALPRWRHTATEVVHRGQRYLFVYGGRGSGQSVRADWGFLHAEELRCRQIPVEGPVPVGRHSHSACGWAGGVLIAGGLDAMERALGSVLCLKPTESGFQWCPVETHPPLTPRYSHTAHVHRGKLLLVGGVWFHAPSVPGVAVIDLATGFTAEYGMDTAGLEWPLMLHSHSSVFMPEEEEVLVMGGGGNCFSFGSHLNRHPVRLALGDILTGLLTTPGAIAKRFHFCIAPVPICCCLNGDFSGMLLHWLRDAQPWPMLSPFGPSAVESKSTVSILDDIGSMFDDLADQLDAIRAHRNLFTYDITQTPETSLAGIAVVQHGYSAYNVDVGWCEIQNSTSTRDRSEVKEREELPHFRMGRLNFQSSGLVCLKVPPV